MRVLTHLLAAATVAAAATAGGGEPAAVRDARNAQRSFEFMRRVRLPTTEARDDDARLRFGYRIGGCTVRIGRLCWFDDGDDSAPPPEPAATTAGRSALLDALARAAAADPANAWVVGQRVRYLLEARRSSEALAVAERCEGAPSSGTPSSGTLSSGPPDSAQGFASVWCLGLRGVVHHLANRPVEAAAAFDSADALRAPADRCAWNDVGVWLESGPARVYHRLACGSPERARWESRFWRLAEPLWMRPANDLRNEWNARRVMALVHGAGSNAYGMSWGDDLAELDQRYGWPTGWSHRPDAGGAFGGYAFTTGAGDGVVGHEPAPSYDFVPRGRALDAERTGAADVPEGTWNLRPSAADLTSPMRYAPAYALGGVAEPTYQLARFLRGDTALVAGAFDTARDSIWSEGRRAPALAAALLVLDDRGDVAGADRRDSVARSGALLARVPGAAAAAARDRWLLGLEILQRDTVHTPDGRRVLGRALRARDVWRPLPAESALSDLLLLRHSPGPTPTLEAALDSVAGSTTVPRGGAIGVYWEEYGVQSGGAPDSAAAPDTIVIAATRLARSLRDRLADAIGRGSVERPIALRFADPGGSGVGRAIGLTWPDVAPGDYRLEVTRVPGTPGRQSATSALVVHLVDPQ